MSEENFAIGFYNLENLFDTTDDLYTLDDDFTSKGFKKWKEKRFYKKLKKLAYARARIGEDDGCEPPVLLGIAEVENKRVIRKLLDTGELKSLNYDFVHFDSPDERGIDTALIYDKDHFELINGETLPLLVQNGNGDRDYTRDILYVHGTLNGEEVHVFVNHWPSRREGTDQTEPKRIKSCRSSTQ